MAHDGHFPLDTSEYRYTISSGAITGYLTETVWRVTQYKNAELFFFSALFGAHQEAVQLRAAMATKASISAWLPTLDYSSWNGATHRYEAQQIVRNYDVRFPARTGVNYAILTLEERSIYQFIFYPEIARAVSTENETLIILPRDFSPAKRTTQLHSYLDNRLYMPMMRRWTDAIVQYGSENGMVEPLLTLGDVEGMLLRLRPKPIREFIAQALRRRELPLEEGL